MSDLCLTCRSFFKPSVSLIMEDRKNYGSIDSTEQLLHLQQNDKPPGHYSTSYEAIMTDSMNESIVSQINDQIASVGMTGPFLTKVHLRNWNPHLTRTPIKRRKSETDIPILKHDLHEDFESELDEAPRAEATSFSCQQKLVLLSLIVIDFTTYGTLSIMAPFFPNEASKKGVNTAMSGLIFSVYALVIFIASPFMGSAVGKIGPKALLIYGIALGGASNMLFGFLYNVEDADFFLLSCLAVRSLEALGAAAFGTAGFTFVAEIFPHQISSVLGILEVAVGLGMSCGPAIGGLLYDFGGYELPFYSVGGLLLLTIPMHMAILPSKIPSKLPPQSVWKLLAIQPIKVLVLVIVVVSIVWGFLDPTLEPHLRQFNLSARHLGLFFLLLSAMYAISSPVWGYISDKTSMTWLLMVVGLLSSAVAILLLGPSGITGLKNTLQMNIIALTILGISISMALLPTFEAMLDIALEHGYRDGVATFGLIGGLWSSAYSLGEVIGPTLGAFLSHHFGFPLCCTVMSGICIVSAIVVLLYFQIIRPRSGE